MTTKPARSSRWRINKSSVLVVEGAQILRALEKVAGTIGLKSDHKVRFATNTNGSFFEPDSKLISIGAGDLFTEAPMPAENFDVLVGKTLHEMGHVLNNTDGVWDGCKSRLDSYLYRPPGSGGITEKEWSLFQKFVNIGEDIIIDHHLALNANLNDYYNSALDWALQGKREPRLNNLLELWIEYALCRNAQIMFKVPAELVEAMQLLMQLSVRLHSGKMYSRYMDYVDIWTKVRQLVLEPPELQSMMDQQADDQQEQDGESPDVPDMPNIPGGEGTQSDQSQDSSQEESGEEDGDDGEKEPEGAEDGAGEGAEETKDGDDVEGSSGAGAGDDDDSGATGADSGDAGEPVDDFPAPLNSSPTPIADDLARQIEEAIESESDDITEEVEAAFNELGYEPVHDAERQIIRSHETQTPKVVPDNQLRKRLERILTIRKALQSRITHGELTGRLDMRKLHRSQTDERIFKERYRFPDGFPNARILIDMSGSIRERQAEEILAASGALSGVVKCQVWAYNCRSTVQLIRLDDGKVIHTMRSDGNTPSGLALVGVSLGMKRGGLIVHLTDGEHNTGYGPGEATQVLAKRGIDAVHLIWGSGDRYEKAYVGLPHMMLERGLAEFPEALYNILVSKLNLERLGAK